MRILQALLFTTVIGATIFGTCTSSLDPTIDPASTTDVKPPLLPAAVYYQMVECIDTTCEGGLWRLSADGQSADCIYCLNYPWPRYGEALPAIQSFALSPNKNVVVVVEEAGYSGIRRNDSLTVSTVFSDGTGRIDQAQYGPNQFIADVAWSSDGERLAFVRRSSYSAAASVVEVLDVISQKVITFEEMDAFSWSPNSQQLMLSNVYGRGLYTASAKTGVTRTLLLAEEGTVVHTPAWSPDGTEIAYVQSLSNSPERQDRLLVTDLALSQTTVITQCEGERIQWLDWSPNGQWLAFSTWEAGSEILQPAKLYVVDRSTWRTRFLASEVRKGEWSSSSGALLLVPDGCPASLRWLLLNTGEMKSQDTPAPVCNLDW